MHLKGIVHLLCWTSNSQTVHCQRGFRAWTSMLGAPEKPVQLDIKESPNPVAIDPELATLHVEGLEKSFSKSVSAADPGILIFNHGLFAPNRRFFDPKIDETNVLKDNIKKLLLERHPEIKAQNIP